MNAQLKKVGLGMAFLALPLFAATANAQWSQTQGNHGVSTTISDATLVVPSQTINARPNHTVGLNQNGELTGQITSIDPQSKSAVGLSAVNVYFVQNNRIVKQGQTNADGSFAIQGLPTGSYSFFAAGNAGFAGQGVYITTENTEFNNSTLEATTASIDSAGIQRLIQNKVPGEIIQALNASLRSANAGTKLSTAKQVQLTGGRLQGRVSSLFGGGQQLDGIQVFLLQNNQTISQVQTSTGGSFSIPDVEAGIYDFVAVSNNGFTTTRFEAVGNSGPITQISYRKPIAQELDACLTCPSSDAGSVMSDQPVDYAMGDVYMEPSYSAPVEYAGESIAYGGASGGSCGCANNFSGFGGRGIVRGRFGGLRSGGGLRGLGAGAPGATGLGQLITLGSLAGGIVAIADDDSEEVSPVN